MSIDTHLLTREVLYDMYWNKKMTLKEIGDVVGCTWSNIRYWFEKFNIPRRSNRETSKLALSKPSIKKKLSLRTKQLWKRPEYRKKFTEKFKGKGNPFYGKQHTEESKEKIKQAHLGRPAWNKGMKPWEWFGLSKDEWVKRRMEWGFKRPTSLELKLMEIIKREDLPFDYVGDGKVIINGMCPDFINNNGGKQLIEVFGDFWHTKDDEKKRRGNFAKYGFETLFIWEHELEDEELVVEKLRRFM